MELNQIDKAGRKLEVLHQREIERKLNNQCRKEDLLSLDTQDENIDCFQQAFKEKNSEIIELVRSSHDILKEKLPSHFNNISDKILALQKHVASSNLFLRTYDIQKCQKTIADLSLELKAMEGQLLPKKKFGFRNKKRVESINPKETSDSIDGLSKSDDVLKVNNLNTKATVIDNNFVGFQNTTHKVLDLPSNSVLKKDVTLNNLSHCLVYVHGAPATLHISNIQHCKIFVGPVSTSIFVDNCSNCIMYLSCQQLRLHSSSYVDIYLHVTSRAIMEDCNNIQFAPYRYSYKNIELDYVAAGLDSNINNWQCIDDFNWLNADVKSPHWNFMQ